MFRFVVLLYCFTIKRLNLKILYNANTSTYSLNYSEFICSTTGTVHVLKLDCLYVACVQPVL